MNGRWHAVRLVTGGDENGLQKSDVGRAADDGDRSRSGIAKPFVNGVRNASGHRRVMLPLQAESSLRKDRYFPCVLRLTAKETTETTHDEGIPPLMRHGRSQGHDRGLCIASGRRRREGGPQDLRHVPQRPDPDAGLAAGAVFTASQPVRPAPPSHARIALRKTEAIVLRRQSGRTCPSVPICAQPGFPV